MAERIRLGVVGVRNIGRNHIRRARELDGVEVIAVCDTDLQRARQAAEEFGVPKTFHDAAEVFALDELDGVILAVPNHLHAPLSIAALDAGKNVLVEKPMAHTAHAALEMIEARDGAGKVLMVGMNQRFFPLLYAAKAQFDAGAIGDILYARTWWRRRRPGEGLWQRGDWFFSHAWAGGGPMMDLGIHKLDQVLHLMGFPRPSTLMGACFAGIGRAEAARFDRHYEIEDAGVGLVRFADGKALVLEASYFLNDRECEHQQAVLYGTRGGARIGGDAGVDVFQVDGDTILDVPLDPPADAPRSAVEHFCNVLRGTEELSSTAEQGLTALRIIEALYISAATGRAVTFSETGEGA